jgi:hypothetical protein
MERIIQGDGYRVVSHFQTPWWSGFNDARDGKDYDNSFSTVTAKYEYQNGFETGSAVRR